MEKKNTLIHKLCQHLDLAIKLLCEFEESDQQVTDENDLGSQFPKDPEVIIKQTDIDKLKIENRRLRARCELLESGNNADVTRRIDDAVNQSHQVEMYTQRISEFKNREEKIIETLGKKALELRTAFFIMTGYSVYACKDIVYKVKSKYAEGKEDKLVFQLSPQGKIKLIENDYSRRFSKHISTYLADGADHFPAFLASVTLELFNNTKAVMSASTSSNFFNSTTCDDMEITLKPR